MPRIEAQDDRLDIWSNRISEERDLQNRREDGKPEKDTVS